MPSFAWSSDVCRSEEHTSELQSLTNLVCRLLLEKKDPHHQLFEGEHGKAKGTQRTCCRRREPAHGAHTDVPCSHGTHGSITFFFFNDRLTANISPIPLPDALPF